jgi:hypothetical protein
MDKKEIARAYYKIYYQKHRQQQIDRATQWYLANEENKLKHNKATLKYLNANKQKVYFNRRIKSLHKTLMRELIDRFIFHGGGHKTIYLSP